MTQLHVLGMSQLYIHTVAMLVALRQTSLTTHFFQQINIEWYHNPYLGLSTDSIISN